ncbi:hypothetical protein LX16_1191 [Stackebrandtia albiflava]|uniref:Uncharacterized protein n=1 Tax=Stackebrandtia albiflava TaxID=406432 RepID=A0A562VCE0_9ACTN|nr:hypothetical protein [Stackebrandtia albiflava]TWJ15481.1 hypothetical protein LX16_1191 [Stackebrandtia albiflava]
MTDYPNTTTDVTAAFPAALRDDAASVAAVLPAWHPYRMSAGVVTFRMVGEELRFPYRWYPDEVDRAAYRSLSSVQRAILDCWYTRHHDGRVRQRSLARILDCEHPWAAPFVIRPVGEYVIEIVRMIATVVSTTEWWRDRSETYGRFLAEDREFFASVAARAVSYWDCYHRGDHALFSRYPGGVVVERLREAANRFTDTPLPHNVPRERRSPSGRA